MLNPRLLTKENANEIKEYLQYSHKYMSLAKFPTLYLWRDFTELKFDIKDGFLFMFECKFSNTALMPFGNGDLEKAMANLEEYCNEVAKSARMYCISDGQMKMLEEIFPGKYNIENSEKFNEYVYLRDNLADLPGKNYAKKRNHISKFLRKYGDVYEYCNIGANDHDEIKRVMDAWCLKKDCGPDDPSNNEENAILELLSGETGIEYKGGAIRINGNIEAFSIGGMIADDMAAIYFEKADTEFDGIYAMLNKLYAEREWEGVRYLNRQEDMGKPGLIKSKSSYYPEFKVNNHIAMLAK